MILAPADSARNVIEPTADATALTLKAFPGQTFTLFDLRDAAELGGISAKIGDDKAQWRIDALPGQTVDDPLILVRDETGNNLLIVNQEAGAPGASLLFGLNTNGASLGELLIDSAGSFQDATLFLGNDNGGTDTGRQIKFTTFADFNAPENNQVAVVLRALADQILPLLDFRATDNSSVLRATPTGTVISNAHAEPDDALLNTSDFATWLDDTAGAPLLMVKARDAAGDVFTASIPLTAA